MQMEIEKREDERMKNVRVITIALMFMAAGASNAASQGAGPYYNVNAMDYPLHEQFPNPPRFVYTVGFPAPQSLDLESLSGATYTDGSGHIAGLVYARVYFDGPANHVTDYGAFSVTVTGTTSNRGTNQLVRFTMRGNGYTFDGVSNHPNATLSLKFTSTNKLVDVPAFAVTNGAVVRTNSAFTFLSGTLRGNVRPGLHSPLNGGKQLNVTENAALVTAGSTWTVVNGTNLLEQPLSGGMVLDVLSNIDAQVIQTLPGSRLFLNANVASLEDLFVATGNANTNTAKWSAVLSGVAFARGSTLSANGTLGPLIVAYQPTTDTNNFPSGYIPQIVPNALQQMTLTSGKLYGQKIPPNLPGVSVPPTPPGP